MDQSTTPAAASVSELTSPATAEASSGRGSNNYVSGKTRSSCDRCHGMKLRCVGEKGKPPCQRCLRLKTLCRYSPRIVRSTRKTREQTTYSFYPDLDVPLSVSNSPHDATSNLTMTNVSGDSWPYVSNEETGVADGRVVVYPDLCYPIQETCDIQYKFWPGVFGDQVDINPLGYSDPGNLNLTPLNDNTRRIFSSFNTSDTYFTSEGRDRNNKLGTHPSCTIGKLSRLSVNVHECAAKLPSMDKTNATSASMAGRGVWEPRKSLPFVFDELFHLTAEFIDIMKSLSTKECEKPPDSFPETSEQAVFQSSQMPTSISQQLSQTGQPVSTTHKTPQSRSLLHVDEATTFIIMSCHCQLTETYATIFQMMQMCVEHSLIPQTSKNWAVILPTLQVGSVALPPLQVDDKTPISSKTTSSMYRVAVTMLLSQLWPQLVEVMRQGGGTRPDSASIPRSSLVEVMWDTAIEKTDRLMQTIDLMVCLLK